jgi:hypothetical protein
MRKYGNTPLRASTCAHLREDVKMKSSEQDQPESQRITITFSAQAMKWIDVESKRRAISMSEFVRRLVDETRGDYITQPRAGR